MSENKKIPKQATARASQKQVKTPEQKTDGKPVWRFSTTDKAGAFAWPKGQDKELEIVQKLHDFDSMLWGEIQGKQHHFLSESCLSKQAKDRLTAIELDDEIDNLFSFHLSGLPRIIAIRHLDVAKLLWYDPDHQVCPSTKKDN